MSAVPFEAVVFDLGGVVLDSPLAVFERFEQQRGLPPRFIGELVITSGANGAWPRLERGELTMAEFEEAFAAEAEARGHELQVHALMQALEEATDIRPQVAEMVSDLRRFGLRTAALTNNWPSEDQEQKVGTLRPLFDVIVESFRVGMRKPEAGIYSLVLSQLGVPAEQAIFLDDIGFNLKPARELGMHTIKVADPTAAMLELTQLLGL